MKLLITAGLFLLASALSLVLSAAEASAQPLFAPPVNLGPKINTPAHESDPFLTSDGKKLFLVRTGNIWFAEWTDTGWTTPQSLGPQINTGPDDETSPSLTPDEQKLYFVAGTRQGFYYDIWVSAWDSSINDWGIPANVGYPVNTTGAEFSAHLAPDGFHLYFSSEAFGRCGIYMSEWDGTSWSVPQLQWGCGTPEYPSVTADGQWLYFDHYVSDGKSIFVAARQDSNWVLPAYDLRPYIGGRASTPFIVPSGDSLFFRSADLVGFGGGDIWMSKRLMRGDLNMDGQLTTADIVLELNKVFLDEPYPAPAPTGDMNCDGQLAPTDAIILLRQVYLNWPPTC